MSKDDAAAIKSFTKASDSLLLTIAKDKKSPTWILDAIKSRILYTRISQLCQVMSNANIGGAHIQTRL